MDIYSKIDKLLEQKKISRRKLAILAGVPPTTLQSAFSRKSGNLSLDVICNIAKVLEVTPFELMGGEYFDVKFGVGKIKQLADGAKLLEAVQNLHGKTAADAVGLLIALNSTGQEKALDYISDLYEQPKYKK